MTAGAQRLDAPALELVLLGRVDRLQRPRLPELDVLAGVELHSLEDVDAARGEMRLEIRLRAPADRVDAAHVHARGARRDLAALEQHDAPAMSGEVIRRRGPGDAAAHDDDIRLDHGAPW